MSFGLPESGLKISTVPISSGQVQLVEGRINWNSDCLALGFPDGFLSGMEILTDSLFNCIPEAHSFGEIKTEGII
jgi:hypothetical protein